MTRYEVELTNEQAWEITRSWGSASTTHSLDEWLLVQIADAIRANPPRMNEPNWRPQVIAHTKDNDRRRGFSVDPWAVGGQWREITGHTYPWSALLDPEAAS